MNFLRKYLLWICLEDPVILLPTFSVVGWDSLKLSEKNKEYVWKDKNWKKKKKDKQTNSWGPHRWAWGATPMSGSLVFSSLCRRKSWISLEQPLLWCSFSEKRYLIISNKFILWDFFFKKKKQISFLILIF